MESFTPDDFNYLTSVPPFLCDHTDLVVKYFGDDQPEHVWDFLHDLVALEKNYAVLEKKKEEEEKEQSLNMADFINKKSDILKKWVDDLIMRLEVEYERRQSDKYMTKGGSVLDQDDSLSTILGALHTLKIDVKVMMDILKCNAEVANECRKGKEEEKNVF